MGGWCEGVGMERCFDSWGIKVCFGVGEGMGVCFVGGSLVDSFVGVWGWEEKECKDLWCQSWPSKCKNGKKAEFFFERPVEGFEGS